MSNNRAGRNAQNLKSAKKMSSRGSSKTKANFIARDKPKFKSGAKPNNRSRDRGVVRSRKRPSSRSRSKTDYKSSDRSSNRYDGGNRRHSDRGTRELHTTRCSECKKETKVPFKPTGVKPVYCRECYQKHKPPESFKQLRSSASRSLDKPNYRSSDRSSRRYDDRNRKHSERGTRELHTTTCSECKKETKVPFKPTGAKPVYCRECYQKHKPQDGYKDSRSSDRQSRTKPNYRSSNRSSSRYEDRSRTRTDGRSKQLHTVICSKCKKETQVPFKPTGDKPVYCRECFQGKKPKTEFKLARKPKTESTPAREKNQIKNDEVVERFGDRKGPYRTNKRMHTTTCRTCKKEIMIPFKPKARKPIYCQDCFKEVGKKK